MCVDDKFSEPFNSYVGEDAVYNFINSMVEQSKYCSDVMKKHFNKELATTIKENEDFKVRDYFHVTGKYKGSPHRNCNIKIKLNQ